MTFHDPYSRSLALKNLLTDEIVNVHSNPEYPQFHASTNKNNAVFKSFWCKKVKKQNGREKEIQKSDA